MPSASGPGTMAAEPGARPTGPVTEPAGPGAELAVADAALEDAPCPMGCARDDEQLFVGRDRFYGRPVPRGPLPDLPARPQQPTSDDGGDRLVLSRPLRALPPRGESTQARRRGARRARRAVGPAPAPGRHARVAPAPPDAGTRAGGGLRVGWLPAQAPAPGLAGGRDRALRVGGGAGHRPRPGRPRGADRNGPRPRSEAGPHRRLALAGAPAPAAYVDAAPPGLGAPRGPTELRDPRRRRFPVSPLRGRLVRRRSAPPPVSLHAPDVHESARRGRLEGGAGARPANAQLPDGKHRQCPARSKGRGRTAPGRCLPAFSREPRALEATAHAADAGAGGARADRADEDLGPRRLAAAKWVALLYNSPPRCVCCRSL